jgi:hypothetical protein
LSVPDSTPQTFSTTLNPSISHKPRSGCFGEALTINGKMIQIPATIFAITSRPPILWQTVHARPPGFTETSVDQIGVFMNQFGISADEEIASASFHNLHRCARSATTPVAKVHDATIGPMPIGSDGCNAIGRMLCPTRHYLRDTVRPASKTAWLKRAVLYKEEQLRTA